LWVGTGTLSSLGGQGGPAIGLLKTTDGGQTWTNLGSAQLSGSPIISIVLASGAATQRVPQIPIVASFGKGLEYSLDGGGTFRNGTVADGSGSTIMLTNNATDVVADPNNADRYYAAVVGNPNTNADGIFRSDDSGVTWTKIDNNLLTLSILTSP